MSTSPRISSSPSEAATQVSQTNGAGGSLGTFAGVFTPSILTILGIILFLRVGYVVGAAGLPRALIIIVIANAISIITSISLSAIATNLRVKGGGDYYLISRTLGVEYGGALGLVLFLAQAVSIAFYAIGFAEVVSGLSGFGSPLAVRAIAGAAVALIFVLAWLGADWATRFQYVVMGILLAALVVFFVGGARMVTGDQLQANMAPGADVPFWVLFAIFFPAVTGFTQGVSMSGDLRDPGKSLPVGTFSAVFLSFGVYIAVAVVFAAALPGETLVRDYTSMRHVALVPWLIDAGVIAATLSSAMASFLGAPRILQSLASDKVFPLLNPFAVGHGATNNPRRAVLLAAVIAYITIGLGNLNAIASVVSMFFLISYGLLNYATYFERRANSPSFRPRFRFFSGRLSLVGALACLAMMLAISPMAGAVAIAVMFALHHYLARSVQVERWADSTRSRRLQRIRDDLHAVRSDLEHARDWRPVLLAFSNDPGRRERLTRFASWLEGGAGFTTVLRIEQGSGAAARRHRKESEQALVAEIRRNDLEAFARVVVAEEVEQAVGVVLQSYGLGRVRPNTVLLNWYDRNDREETPGLAAYTQYVQLALRFDCNVVLLAARTSDFEALGAIPSNERVIDVWFDDSATGRLMLLLAYLLTRGEQFEEATIRLFAETADGETEDEARQRLTTLLDDVRIDAEPWIVAESGPEIVLERSKGSAVVFQPFRLRAGEAESSFGGGMEEVVHNLGISALVRASEEIVLDSEPESGRHADLASAVDILEQMSRRQREAESELEEAMRAHEAERQAADAANGESNAAAEVAARLTAAEERVERARRRLAREGSKLELARKKAADLEETGEISTPS